MCKTRLFSTSRFKYLFYSLLKKLGLIPDNIIAAQELDVIRGIEKQLDEYRELLEDIERRTGYFSSPQGEFSSFHAATLDDYLSHLYTLRYLAPPNPDKPVNALRHTPLFMPSQKKELINAQTVLRLPKNVSFVARVGMRSGKIEPT